MIKKPDYVTFYLSISKDTHEYIAKLAEKNGRTLTSQVRMMLEKMAAKK